MKRVLATIVAAVMTATALVGCKSSTTETTLTSIEFDKYVKSLGEYKGMQLTSMASEITDEYVESYVQYVLANSQQKVLVTENRPVQSGDVANIDYVGTKDGVAFDGGTAQGYDLTIGSGTFIEGFEDGLIGVSVGETVDLNLTFPENYGSADLAGQAVVFTVTVNSISELVTPELTDEYVKSLGMEGCENVEQFYAEARKSLEDSEQADIRSDLESQILQNVFNGCEFTDEIPEELVAYYKGQIESSFTNTAASAGMALTDYISLYYGMTEEEFQEEISTGALNSARQAIACAMIAEKEGIVITDAEFEEQVEKNYQSFGYDSVDAFMANGNPNDYRDYLLTMEVFDFLIDNAVITEAAEETATETVETEAAATEEAAE